jgi:hypothetical protein
MDAQVNRFACYPRYGEFVKNDCESDHFSPEFNAFQASYPYSEKTLARSGELVYLSRS